MSLSTILTSTRATQLSIGRPVAEINANGAHGTPYDIGRARGRHEPRMARTAHPMT